MTVELESNDSYDQIDMQQQVNVLINNRNNKVDLFKGLYEKYLLFDNEKHNLSFVKLLQWQPKVNLFIIMLLIFLGILGLYKALVCG